MKNLCLFLFVLLPQVLMAQQPPVIWLETNRQKADYGVLKVKNLPEQLLTALQQKKPIAQDWKKLFPVYTGGKKPADTDQPSIIGDYFIKQTLLCFKPRFFWVNDLHYYCELRLLELASFVQQNHLFSHSSVPYRFEIDAPPSPATFVTKVYPSASTLPANLLRMYVYFSAPMRQGQAKKFIKIRDANGAEVPHVFVPIREELWNHNRTRLTLFFDPGRIKRGLRPHHEAGTPLNPGQVYTLEIDKNWQDAQGRELKASFQKRFTTTQADRTQPHPKKWALQLPKGNSKKPLVINALHTIDHALVQRYLYISNAEGQEVKGKWGTANTEKEIRFAPTQQWLSGKYTLYIDTRLEDLAGNSVRQLFDVDTQHTQTSTNIATTLTINFEVF
ncbi:hypothetical protein M23134_02797 [Microscilla marina ATCC 23134]|uniref:SbsA Ig-like domain-containing protein n=2 Tax=Microscilla marina TaxID=1027 RepID=A1ZPP5_MICM2|nr:hypothetical protein M23134_02797 [Microscilla marina ATCC 23134]